MKIESKFNIKDKVFFLESNKVRTAIVKSIKFPMVQLMKGEQTIIGHCMYYISDRMKSSVINWNGGGIYEYQLFASKKDLLNSL